MLTISILADTFEFSGLSRQGLSWVLESLALGRKVSLCVLGQETPWSVKAAQAGAFVECLGWKGAWDLAPLFRLRKWLKQIQGRVIVLGGNSLNALALTNPRKLQSALFFFQPKMLQRASWFFKKAVAKVEKILCPTFHSCDLLKQSGLGEKAIHLPPGISILSVEKTAGNLVPYLFLGGPFNHLREDQVAVWAMDILHLVHPDLQLIAAGEGPICNELQEFHHSLNSPGAVKFTGVCQAMEPLLSGSEMVLVANRSPGGYYSILEGMLAGKTVLAFRQPGVEEFLHHDESGILINEKDPGIWAREIHGLLGCREKAEALGSAARKCAQENFSAKRNASSLLDLYDKGC